MSVTQTRWTVSICAALVGAWLAGCSGSGSGSSSASASSAGSTASTAATAEVSAAAKQQAETIFGTRCTPCHGAQGRGDGPASASLSPHPRNFTDHAWQGQVTDDQLSNIIRGGGMAVGKSAAMPANPDLNDKPEVVAALVAHIRSLGQ